jgi:hypothetical protein
MVSDASFIFNQSSLITDQVLSRAEFEARANQTFNQFKLNTVAESKHSLALIRSQTVTMYTTGVKDITWRGAPLHNSSYPIYFQPISTQIGNCSCALNDECKQQVALYNHTGQGDLFFKSFVVLLNISNIFTSCFTIQSLLQSSLQCFFDQTCADPVLEQIITYRQALSWTLLNPSILERNSTRFSPNTFVEEIVNEMMIETWGNNSDYSQYYEECAPKLCTYLVTSRNDVLYIFTTMFALFGGLSVALRIIVPLIVTWIRNRIYRRVEANNVTGKSFRNKENYLYRNSYI